MVISLVFVLVPSALAQPTLSPDELLRAMSTAVERADFDVAESRAREALLRIDQLTPGQIVRVHTTLGILLHTRNEPVEAQSQFEAALSLNPSLRLDPILVSPKTIEFFDEVRAGFEPGASTSVPDIRYLVLEDQRPGAALRSLALPGWGQFYKGDTVRGAAFAGAAVLTAGGLVLSAVQFADAKAEYDAGTDPGEIADLYDRYNRWTLRRDGFAIGAAVVWSAAVLEALITGAPEAPSQVAIQPATEGPGVRVLARF